MRSKPDDVLGISFNPQNNFSDSGKELRRLTSKDTPIVQATIRGNLTAPEAALLGIIVDIAGDDEGTATCVIQNIATTKGVDGITNWQTMMVQTGALVERAFPSWATPSKAFPGKDKTPKPTNGAQGGPYYPNQPAIHED